MKKLFGVIIFLLLLAFGSGIAFYFYLPTLIVKSITTDEGIQIFPTEVKEAINKSAERLPVALEELDLDITVEDIIEVLDKMPNKEIITTINTLNNTDLESEEQVISIARENINWYQIDTEKTRKAAKENLTLGLVRKALKMINENGKPFALTIPIAKETIKGILIEKREQVEKKINS